MLDKNAKTILERQPILSFDSAIQMIEAERINTFYRYPAMNSAIKHALTAMYSLKEKMDNPPLSIEEIEAISEPTPIWIQSPIATETGWYICLGTDKDEDDCIAFANGDLYPKGTIRVGKITMHRHKPTAETKEENAPADPLPKYLLSKLNGQMIRIHLIGRHPSLPDFYAPYYGKTERYVVSGGTSSIRLPLDEYGTTWFAYEPTFDSQEATV